MRHLLLFILIFITSKVFDKYIPNDKARYMVGLGFISILLAFMMIWGKEGIFTQPF